MDLLISVAFNPVCFTIHTSIQTQWVCTFTFADIRRKRLLCMLDFQFTIKLNLCTRLFLLSLWSRPTLDRLLCCFVHTENLVIQPKGFPSHITSGYVEFCPFHCSAFHCITGDSPVILELLSHSISKRALLHGMSHTTVFNKTAKRFLLVYNWVPSCSVSPVTICKWSI